VTRRMTEWLLRTVLLAAISACGPAPSSPEVEFSGPPGSGQPNLALEAGETAVLTWLEPVSGGHALRVATRSGAGWSAPRPIAESDSFFVNWADFPSLVALPNGAWIAQWPARVPGGVYAYHLRLAISRDRGATWTPPITPHRDRTAQEHGFVSLVSWDDSTAALVWLDGREMRSPGLDQESEGEMTLRFTTITASGRLGPETLLDARTCECCQTALARTRSALVAAYRDRSPREIRDIAVVRRLPTGTWTTPALVASDNWYYPGCPVNGPALSAAGDTVVLAWFTAPEGKGRVSAAFSADGGATWTAPIRVDDGRPLGRVDVELLDARGGRTRALGTWLEGGPRAEVRARTVSAGGRRGGSWRVAESSEARSAGFPRALRVGNEVLFAWTAPEGIRVAAQRLPD